MARALEILLMVFCLLLLFVVFGCASAGRGVEPEWAPHPYSPDPLGECEFTDTNGDVVNCSDPRMEEMYLAPLTDLDRLQTKLNRCMEWK